MYYGLCANDRQYEFTVLKQQSQLHAAVPPQSLLQMQSNMPPNWNNLSAAVAPLQNVANVNSNIASQTETINAQIIKAQEQIRQSEQNLSAQHTVSKLCYPVLCEKIIL